MVVFLTTPYATDHFRALLYLLRGLPDDGTHDVPKRVADLLASDVYTLW